MMNLYSGTTCPFSHRCRIVLYEKGMDFQVIDVDLFGKPEDIAIINPYNRVPVLVEIMVEREANAAMGPALARVHEFEPVEEPAETLAALEDERRFVVG